MNQAKIRKKELKKCNAKRRKTASQDDLKHVPRIYKNKKIKNKTDKT